MNITTAAKKLTDDGKGTVLISTMNLGTDEAKLLVILQTEGAAADGPYVIDAPGATEDDIGVTMKTLRDAVDVLSKVVD